MLSARKKIWIEILLHLLFWAVIFYALTTINNSHIHRQVKNMPMWHDQYGDSDISAYVYLTLVFLSVLFYGNIFWIFRKAIRYKSGIARLAICCGWFILVFSMNYLVVGPFFDEANPPIDPPPIHIHTQREIMIHDSRGSATMPRMMLDRVGIVNFMISDWGHLQPILLFAFLVILGISFAYFFLKQWARSEFIQLSTENKFLRSQINPHFLFNTLNNLFSMAQAKGNDELADGISKLSGMMRYMLYDSNAEKVQLGTEIAYLEECITLNKLRYADEEVIVKFSYPEQTNGLTIAPMLFIPFVENAFKHGVAIGQTTTITIRIVVSAQSLTFTCENTNHSAIKKMDTEKSGIGLENVKRRLELLYTGKHRLQITENGEKFMVNLDVNFA